MKFGRLAMMAASLMLAGLAISAQGATTSTPQNTEAAKTTKAVMHHLMGTISSVTTSDVVVAHKVRGKEENSTFALNSQTKKEGNVAAGAHAVVYYRVQNKQNTATEVKIEPAKS